MTQISRFYPPRRRAGYVLYRVLVSENVMMRITGMALSEHGNEPGRHHNYVYLSTTIIKSCIIKYSSDDHHKNKMSIGMAVPKST